MKISNEQLAISNEKRTKSNKQRIWSKAMIILSLLIAHCSLFIACENPFWPDAPVKPCKHDFVLKVINEPDCVNDGEEILTCTKCNEKKGDIQVINALGHDFAEVWEKNSTHHWKECLRDGCDAKNEEAAHTFDEGKCSVCEAIDPDFCEHDYSGDWITDETYHWKECENCGEESGKDAHDWEDGVCLICDYECEHDFENGECKICKELDPDFDPCENEHTYSEEWTTIPATCTENGKQTKTCLECGFVLYNDEYSAPATGHTPGAAATCTTAQTCTVCSAVITAALGHDFTVSVPALAATCEAAGYTAHTKCSRCDEVTGKTVTAATGHTPGSAATCTTSQTCTVCSAVITAALGHNLDVNGECTRCDYYSYTVTFKLNYGTNATHATKTVEDPATTIDALPAKPTRSGFVFGSWNTESDGTGTTFRASTTVTANITVYAKWLEGYTSDTGIDFVAIPEVEDWTVAGGNNTAINNKVNLSGFYIGMYEVTQEQWTTVMAGSDNVVNPSYFHGGSGREPDGTEDQGKRPVENITWFDTLEFCNRLSIMEELDPVYTWTSVTRSSGTTGYITAITGLQADFTKNGYRLPTEAQWQYAAQGGSTTEYTATLDNAWYSSNSNSKTHEVGKKEANDFGLYDMLGNVWEWCWDIAYDESWNWQPYPYSTDDPTGASSGSYRVDRGGGWINSASDARSAIRSINNPNAGSYFLGFRVARP